MKYVPNLLTILRMFLIPVFVFFFFSPMKNNHIYALIVFLTASGTDMLDGYIARKYDFVTVVGIVLDPLADKLMLITALISLAIYGIMPYYALAMVCVIESLQISAGVYMYFKKNKTAIPANKFGKAATVLFATAVFLMITLPEQYITGNILIAALSGKALSFLLYLVDFLNSIKVKNKD